MTIQNDAKNKDESKEVANSLQSKLAEKIMGVFELVVSDRSGHFAKHPDKIPDKKSAPSIITSYSITNAAITGSVSLVPGPWGLVAVIPEIAVVFGDDLPYRRSVWKRRSSEQRTISRCSFDRDGDKRRLIAGYAG
jgi:hypothetical protein